LYTLLKHIGKISAGIVLTACSTLASAQLGSLSTDLVYTPVTPCRMIDTRSAPAGQMAAGSTRAFNAWTTTNFASQGGISTSNCGIPTTTDTAAIVVYFTVVAPSAAGYITTFPGGVPQPLASTVNFGAGEVKGNNATLKLDQTSGITTNHFKVFASSATHLVADVVGYYAKPTALPLTQLDRDLVYTPITPCRIVDTRNPAADTGILTAGSTRSFLGWNGSYTLQGGDNSSCGLPYSTNNAAIVVNFAVVGPSAAGYITAYPADKAQPFAATVNYVAGDVKGNNTILKLNQTTGQADFKVYSSASTHLVADVVGYYATPVALGVNNDKDLVYTPVTPCRIVDTRNLPSSAFTAMSTRDFIGWGANFSAQGGAASDCGLPLNTNNAALAVNFAIVGPAADGYITAFPGNLANSAMPLAATLNYYAGDVKANNTVLKLNQTGTGPHFKVYSTSASHLIADVVGYYAKPKP
jgi:hypothetical protein